MNNSTTLAPGTTIDDIVRLLDLPKRLMTETEVAKIKCCSIQKLRNDRHCRRGLPYVKINRSVRYAPADVAAEIMGGRIDPEAI